MSNPDHSFSGQLRKLDSAMRKGRIRRLQEAERQQRTANLKKAVEAWTRKTPARAPVARLSCAACTTASRP